MLSEDMRKKTTHFLLGLVFASVIMWVWWFSSNTFTDSSLIRDINEPRFRDLNPGVSANFLKLKKQPFSDDNTDLRFISHFKKRKGDSYLHQEIDLNSINIPNMKAAEEGDLRNESYDNVEGSSQARGLTFRNRIFFLNDEPFRIFSGAIHYFRVMPQYWEDRLKKLKACGLNTVETYVAWHQHEPSPGFFNFNGMLDVRKFIQLAGDLGLYVILRPGPYICAELDYGGLPGWLLRDPNMKVRTNYPGYVQAVRRYFDKLLPQVKDLQFSEGGPIIMVQVENEYSAYGTDVQHLKMLTYLLKTHGIKELLVTCDNRWTNVDFHEYALPTANFAKPSMARWSKISEMNEHFPLMVMELWSGWFDKWGVSPHSTRSAMDVRQALSDVIDIGASLNVYMFHGGTNFGFTSGALNLTSYTPLTTSYDYDALLTEAGDITPKYRLCRKVFAKFYRSIGIDRLPTIPPDLPKAAYGQIQVQEVMAWNTFITLLPITSMDDKVDFMEAYMDHHGRQNTLGYIVYSHYMGDDTYFNKMPGIQISGSVRDRLLAVMNSELFYIVHGANSENDPFLEYSWDKLWQVDPYEYVLDYGKVYDDLLNQPSWTTAFLKRLQAQALKLHTLQDRGSQRLDLMVENQGRVGYSKHNLFQLDQQRKGLGGPVFRYIFGLMEKWEIRAITFDPEQCQMLSRSSTWEDIGSFRARTDKKRAPALFRAYLDLSSAPKDTFVLMDGWLKGVVVVNGFHLGRYWNIGPQRTLYLPAPLLTVGRNEIIVFEEEKWGTSLSFVSDPKFG